MHTNYAKKATILYTLSPVILKRPNSIESLCRVGLSHIMPTRKEQNKHLCSAMYICIMYIFTKINSHTGAIVSHLGK